MADTFKTCAVDGCNGNAHISAQGRKGFCCKHYVRQYRHGHVNDTATRRGSLQEWLRNNVDHEDASACLIWPYGRTGSGYGQFKSKGKCYLAHRWMCEATNGKPPSKQSQAAHSCGNGHLGCVNPHHLRWASPKENVGDKRLHGRMPQGERHSNARLTQKEVLEIYARKGTASHAKIAEDYAVTKETIGGIMRGTGWAWLTGAKKSV